MMRTLFVGQSCAEAESVPYRMATAANTPRRIALPPLSSWPRPDVSWCARQAKGRATVGAATKLRNLFASGHIAVAPGAYDGLSARLVAQAGFPAIYASGGAIARSVGVPDLGLITPDEIGQRLPRIVQAGPRPRTARPRPPPRHPPPPPPPAPPLPRAPPPA